MTTPTFASRDVLDMRTYDLMASPLLYPGQMLKARLAASAANPGPVTARFRLRVFGTDDQLQDQDGPMARLAPGEAAEITWQVPETGGDPIGEVGLAFSGDGAVGGRVVLDYLRWDGAPDVTLRRPASGGDFWRRAWVNGADILTTRAPQSFRIAQSRGEGIISCGTRQWTDYRVRAALVPHLGDYFGLAVRVQGLRRYYGARVTRQGELQIVRVRDGAVNVLAACRCPIAWDVPLPFDISVTGPAIVADVGGQRLVSRDEDPGALRGGGVGLFVHEGAVSTDAIAVGPCDALK